MGVDKYVYGYDFGTQSCRLIIVNIKNGQVVAEGEEKYPNGVITENLPGSDKALPHGWCLQDPDNYIEAMSNISKKLLSETGICNEDIIGIGTDFTNCTMMPMDKSGNVLCQKEEFRDNPHSWVKLWKHHAAQQYAEEIESYARLNTEWLVEYGNNVSSEWFFPKLLQIYREAPEIYEAADIFIEAADWIVFKMTGNLIRNSATLGVNCFWSPERGYPDKTFFYDIEPGLENVIEEKMKGSIAVVGSYAGHLTQEFAEKLGLATKTVVSVGHGDSEVAACGTTNVEPGTMIMVMGTSTCHQMIYSSKKGIQGISSVVRDGMIPGYYAYESGQPAVGDIFEWYANVIGSDISILNHLEHKASELKAGESGLIALDWFNGNRSILTNYDLTGMIMGLTLSTTNEEIYRSLLESTAFGTKVIIDGYESNGIRVNKVIASGGLPRKSKLLMQIYADVLNKKVLVPLSTNNSALGAAVCGAVAAKDYGGYESFDEAIEKMVPKNFIEYIPNENDSEIYQKMFKVFKALHDYLGGDSESPMMQLRNIHKSVHFSK
jgi:L-ribulokinase